MTPQQALIMRELRVALTPTTAKTIAALTGLPKDETETALASLTDAGKVHMTRRSGVWRYAAL